MLPTSSRSTDLGGRPIDCHFFSFCNQTLKMGANDTSGQVLQCAVKFGGQTIFLRKLWASEVLNMKPRNNNRQFPYEILYSWPQGIRYTARGAPARVFVNFRNFAPCITRTRRARGFDSLPTLSDVGTLSFR
jgi:hypothetical protein